MRFVGRSGRRDVAATSRGEGGEGGEEAGNAHGGARHADTVAN